MSPPTNIDGTDITGATIDGQDVQEITVDGQTVFSALPDSLLARYNLDDNPPYTESVNGFDATDVGGLTQISSVDFQGGAARQGDGSTKYANLGSLGSFGSELDDFSVAFTVDNLGNGQGGSIVGVDFQGASGIAFVIETNVYNSGDIRAVVADTSGEVLRGATNSGGHIDDSGIHRVLISRTSSSNYDYYVADKGDPSYTEVSSSINLDTNPSGYQDFPIDVYLYARNRKGNDRGHFPGVLDDVRFYTSSLNSSDRQTDLDAQPAFG